MTILTVLPSFTQILHEENRQRKESWNWAWDAQERVERQRSKMLEAREKMLLEAPEATGVREKFVIEAAKPVDLITAGESDNENGEQQAIGVGEMVRIEAGGDVQDIMAPKKDTRSAAVDGWKFKVSRLHWLSGIDYLFRVIGSQHSHVCSRC